MTESFHCGDYASLVGYLYEDCEPGERDLIETHVARCAACSAELESLRATREQLGSWVPPEAALGFQITRSQASGPRLLKGETSELASSAAGIAATSVWKRPLPAWAQVAAAVLIFASGVMIGVSRETAPVPQAAVAVPTATEVDTVTADDLAGLERRVLGEVGKQMAQVRATAASSSAQIAESEERDLLRKVRALLDESESRQRADFTLRTAALARQFDAQRRVDLAQFQGSVGQMQQSMGQMQRVTGAEVRDQRQAVDYLLRVAQRR